MKNQEKNVKAKKELEKAKNKVNGFFAEFKKFITRGNVVDMAVGIIVGAAFTAIVTAISDGILRPLINWALAALFGDGDALAGAVSILKPKYDADDILLLEESIYINWGSVISAIINFLTIAFVLFCVAKAYNGFNELGSIAKDDLARATYKKEHGIRLSKKEKMVLLAAEAAEAEAKEKADADAKAAEEAAALAKEQEEEKREQQENRDECETRQEALLREIRDLLKKN